MSLIQARWIVSGVAAATAVVAPLWLLRPETSEIEVPPPIVITELATIAVGGVDQARATPIFSPTRAPPDLTASVAAAPVAPAAASRPMPALVGLVSRARGKGVALVKGSDGKTVTVTPGESVDGWRLVGVGRDRATFVANGERRVASLDFSNRGAADGAPASSPPPAAPPPQGVPAGSVRQSPFPAWPEPWLANQSGTPR